MSNKADRLSRAFIREYSGKTCGVTLVDLESSSDHRTADYEMIDSGKRILVAELKTFEKRRPSVEAGWTIRVDRDGIQEAHRPHNGPARVARKIAEAYDQLAAYPHPWAVIFLNADHFMDVGDFFEAFSGERVLGTIDGHGVINVGSRGVAFGHTLRTRYKVDLYMWIDRQHKPVPLVRWSTADGEKIARRYFAAAAGSVSS